MSKKATEKAVRGNLNSRSLTNQQEVDSFVLAIAQREMEFLDTKGATEGITRNNINGWLNDMEMTYGAGMVRNNVYAGYGGYGIAHRAARIGMDFEDYKELYELEIKRLSQVDLTKARLLRNAIGNNMLRNPDDVEKLYASYDKFLKSNVGKSLFEIKKEFIQKSVFNEVIFFWDSAGRKWSCNRYAEMVARTRSREIEDIIMTDEMEEVGLDVVQINDVSTVTPICLQYENKYFSKFGKTPNLPILDVFPPFHPNCRHRMLPQREFENSMVSVNSKVDKKVAKDSKSWTSSEKKQVKQQTEWNQENRQ